MNEQEERINNRERAAELSPEREAVEQSLAEERQFQQQYEQWQQRAQVDHQVSQKRAHVVKVIIKERMPNLPMREELLEMVDRAFHSPEFAKEVVSGEVEDMHEEEGVEIRRQEIADEFIESQDREAAEAEVVRGLERRDSKEDQVAPEAEVASGFVAGADIEEGQRQVEREQEFDEVVRVYEQKLRDAQVSDEQISQLTQSQREDFVRHPQQTLRVLKTMVASAEADVARADRLAAEAMEQGEQQVEGRGDAADSSVLESQQGEVGLPESSARHGIDYDEQQERNVEEARTVIPDEASGPEGSRTVVDNPDVPEAAPTQVDGEEEGRFTQEQMDALEPQPAMQGVQETGSSQTTEQAIQDLLEGEDLDDLDLDERSLGSNADIGNEEASAEDADFEALFAPGGELEELDELDGLGIESAMSEAERAERAQLEERGFDPDALALQTEEAEARFEADPQEMAEAERKRVQAEMTEKAEKERKRQADIGERYDMEALDMQAKQRDGVELASAPGREEYIENRIQMINKRLEEQGWLKLMAGELGERFDALVEEKKKRGAREKDLQAFVERMRSLSDSPEEFENTLILEEHDELMRRISRKKGQKKFDAYAEVALAAMLAAGLSEEEAKDVVRKRLEVYEEDPGAGVTQMRAVYKVYTSQRLNGKAAEAFKSGLRMSLGSSVLTTLGLFGGIGWMIKNRHGFLEAGKQFLGLSEHTFGESAFERARQERKTRQKRRKRS